MTYRREDMIPIPSMTSVTDANGQVVDSVQTTGKRREPKSVRTQSRRLNQTAALCMEIYLEQEERRSRGEATPSGYRQYQVIAQRMRDAGYDAVTAEWVRDLLVMERQIKD